MPESDGEMRARLGARVKELRVARGWSMQELGDVTGCTRSYIGQIEQGKITLPKRAVLLRLAEALKTSPEDLLWAAGYLHDSELISPRELMIARSLGKLSEEDLKWLLDAANRLNRAS